MKTRPVVLISDDDLHVRDALSARLIQADFEVVATSNAPAAIEAFNRRTPDAAILDVQMPGSDGLTVCEHIRKQGSDIPVFILTGADIGIIRHNLEKLTTEVGANHFVTKPYDGKALVLMLRKSIQSAASSTPLPS